MAQLVVRRLAQDVKDRLRRRARRHGRSLEEEVRLLLHDAVKRDGRAAGTLGTRIAARFSGAGLAADLPELRGQAARAARFDP